MSDTSDVHLWLDAECCSCNTPIFPRYLLSKHKPCFTTLNEQSYVAEMCLSCSAAQFSWNGCSSLCSSAIRGTRRILGYFIITPKK